MTFNADPSDTDSAHPLIPFELDESSKIPIYKQLVDGLRESILSNSIIPGTMLPSTRDLSRSLKISRSTVLRCYEELLSQGYLKSVEGIGTFVSEKLPARVERDTPVPVNTFLKLSKYAELIMDTEPEMMTSGGWEELNFGAAPIDQLPRKFWRQVLLKNCREYDIHIGHYEFAPFGYRPLREAMAEYLVRSRALKCSPEQVAIYFGSLYGVNLLARLLIDEGDLVAVENPGFPYARQVFATHGARICPVPVDDDGIIVDELERRAIGCRLVYVTPSHQDPTGAVLSLERRRQLLAWARDRGVIIVEDDFGGEYRYVGPQVPSLQGLDEADLVIHLSSFWKTLFPLVNCGYIVMPRALIPVVWKAQVMRDSALNTSFPALEQTTLTDFIEGGYLERYIRKSHSVYAVRCRALISELKRHLWEAATWRKEPSATHLVVTLKPEFSPEHIMRCAEDSGFAMVSTNNYYVENPKRCEYMVPFAHVEPHLMQEQVKKFAELLYNTNSVIQHLK